VATRIQVTIDCADPNRQDPEGNEFRLHSCARREVRLARSVEQPGAGHIRRGSLSSGRPFPIFPAVGYRGPNERSPMSAFTPTEIDYLNSQGLARLATVGPDGQPHVVPLTFVFNAEEDAIDVGGVDFGKSKKWRDARRNPKVTVLLDDVLRDPRRARALEVRGRAEAVATGGATINPRFPNFAEEFLRIRPTHIVSWGLEDGDGTTPAEFRLNSRPVG
jgi:pyridoxamine 5'-phosphate oxidase family protein